MMKPTDRLLGSRVMLAHDRSRRGRVVRVGVEQSTVRLDGEKVDRVFPNEQLVSIKLRVISRGRRRA